ncbi:MAG: sugar ABC transporter permease [Acidobacteria bacterium]|nr:sugar ABC transporter permease [Acidobacteriota bacterium]
MAERALQFQTAQRGSLPDAIESFVDRRLALLFPLPALVAMAAVVALPVLYVAWLSLYDWNLNSARPMSFVGLDNYVNLLTRDTRFRNSLWVTAVFTIVSVVLQMALGLGIALLLNRNFRGKTVARTAILLPMIATPAAMALVWRVMFNPQLGIINELIRLLGHPGFLWVAHPSTALASLIAVDVLRETPMTVIILLAGLQALPSEPYEAAKIDGASRWQSFWHITLPLLRSAIMVALIFRAIFTIKVFDVIYVITQGGPSFSTENFAIFAYLQSFTYWRMGYGAATAMLFFLLILAVVLPMIAWRRKSWEY